MRRFAANYLLTQERILLKNGIASVSEDGIVRFMDTKGDLRESERLIFYNGILMKGYDFIKDPTKEFFSFQNSLQLPAFYSAAQSDHLTQTQIIDLACLLQDQFPNSSIPDLLVKIEEMFMLEAGFSKEPVPGIFLLTGADLINLRFTPKSRLKKII